MQSLQEKIKSRLLLSDKDVDLLLKCKFQALLAQNKDAVIRLGMACIGVLIFIMMFFGAFSASGAFFKLILIAVFFGTTALIVLLKKAAVLEMTKYPFGSYFLIGVFGFVMVMLLSDLTSDASFFSKFLFFLVAGGVGGGIYTFRQKAADQGLSIQQLAVVGMFVCALFLSLQMTVIRYSVDQKIEMAQRRSEMRRQRDAEQMSRNQASMKVCSSEEECKKMNMKKNSYYAEYEELAQEVCESAVAKEISGRFEWTVSAKDYKFGRYEVDVLKDEISLFGDRARLISNNNTKTNIKYVCKYNTKKKTASATVQAVK